MKKIRTRLAVIIFIILSLTGLLTYLQTSMMVSCQIYSIVAYLLIILPILLIGAMAVAIIDLFVIKSLKEQVEEPFEKEVINWVVQNADTALLHKMRKDMEFGLSVYIKAEEQKILRSLLKKVDTEIENHSEN